MIKVIQVCLYHLIETVSRGRRKNKLSETSLIGNKIIQDPDNMSKETNVGSSIEGTKISSILTPPLYTNKKDYKGGKK